jgi:hypothetical protein
MRGVSPTGPTPRPFPAAYRTGPALKKTYVPGVEPIAAVPPPGAVIAASLPTTTSLPSPTEATQDPNVLGEMFASERPPGSPRATENKEPSKIIDWSRQFPMPVPEHGPAPVVEEVFGSDLPPTKWYSRGEYLLWWTKHDRTPPLVTTGTIIPGRDNDLVGAIDQRDTVTLFGGDLRRDPFSGARFTFGYYLDDCGEKALEVSGFFLGRRSDGFQDSTFTNSIISRPFFDVVNGVQSVQQVSFPGRAFGRVDVTAPSELWGIEANMLCKWCCDCNWRVDPLVGFRYLNLRESLSITELVLVDRNLAGDPLAGASLTVQDRFATRNQFYGGQVGIEGRLQRDRWTFDGRVKVGLGITEQFLRIDGGQVVQFPNGTVRNFVGGLLALDSNIGTYERNRFSIVPEVSVSAGYYLTERLRAMVGYNFLYWSNIVRPGEQIDFGLDVNRIPNFVNPPMAPTVARPAVLFKSTDFWAQGLTLALEYRY